MSYEFPALNDFEADNNPFADSNDVGAEKILARYASPPDARM